MGKAGENEGDTKIYRASLQQFEDLMGAAAATGYAGRPLPLYYALTQAGRAIVAARGGGLHKGHGIRLSRPEANILRSRVHPNRQKAPGQFQTVASAVASPKLDGPAELGGLLASLPELSDKALSGTDWPRALPVVPEDADYAHIRSSEWLPVKVVFDEEARTAEHVKAVLRNYPSAKSRAALVDTEVRQFSELPRHWTPFGSAIKLLWRDEGRGIDAAFPTHRASGGRWLRPAVVEDGDPPSLLMTWWALLLGLSSLARYHPVPWVQSLNPDSSASAVLLERAMTEPLDILPQLVLDALLGGSNS